MRSILVLLGGLIVGGWIGGETLLARQVGRIIAADPRLSAAGVEELREAQRIGIRISQPRFAQPGTEAEAGWLDLWLRPEGPNTAQAALAPGATATLAGRRLALGPEGAGAGLSFSPAHGFDLSEARITAGGVTLDGAPVLDGLTLDAVLTGFGADTPQGTGATYAVTGTMRGLGLGAATAGRLPGTATLEGGGRLWLSAVPLSAGALARGTQGGEGAQPVRLVGLRLDGVGLTLDDLSARLFGRLTADAAGLAQGEVLIDTADAPAFIDRAAAAGLIPEGAVPLANTVLKAAAAPPSPATPDQLAEAATSSAADTIRSDVLHSPGWPAPRAGELRLPLIFHDGTVTLGALPLGPAPRLAPPAS